MMVNINLYNALEEKQKLIEEIYNTEEELRLCKHKLKEKETSLWTDTNFKEMGFTNHDTRTAYVQSQLIEEKFNKDEKHNLLMKLKRQLEVCDDKIRLFSI